MSIKQQTRRAGLAALVVTSLVAWAAVPTPAEAAVPKDLKAELEGHVEKAGEVEDIQATQALLMLQGRIGGKSIRGVLSEKAEAEQARERLGATIGLWFSGDRGASNTLVEQLGDDKKLYLTLREVITVLPDDKEKVLLKRLVKSAEDRQKGDVFRYIGQQHGELYGLLEGYLTGQDKALRKAAVQAAKSTTRDEADDYAAKMLSSRTEEVRADGLDLAIAMNERPDGSKQAEKNLEDAMDDRSEAVAEKAALYLVTQGHSEAAKKIEAKLAAAEDDDRKKELARHLLEHGASVSLDTAQPLIDSEDDGLTDLGWQLAATTGDEEIFAELRKMFGGTHFDQRIIAAKALGRTDNKAAVGMLSKGLFEGNANLRRHSAVGLGRLGEPRGLNALKKALTGERDREVKMAVVEAVSHIDSDESLRLLRFQATARDPKIKLAVVRAIRRLGQKDGARALKVVRNDRDAAVKWETFLTTLELDEDEGVQMFRSALRNPPDGFMSDIEKLDSSTRTKVLTYILKEGKAEHRAQALGTARRIGEPLFDVFRELVQDADTPENTRRELLIMLSERRHADDVGLFERLVRDADSKSIKHMAAWTLVEYATKDLEATFRGMLGHDDPALSALAGYGLAAIHDK